MTSDALRLTFLLVLLSTSSAGAGAVVDPPLPPPDPQAARIGLEVRLKQGLKRRIPAETVFFVRLEEAEDSLSASDVVAADYSTEGQIYLLNARAGRYAAVACKHSGFPGLRGLYTFYFSQDLIRLTEVTVEAGDLRFLGRFRLKPASMKRADPAQSHYYHLIQPLAAGRGLFALSLGKIYPGLALPHQLQDERVDEVEFWRLARERHFAHDQVWRDLIDRHLEGLGGP